MAESPRVPERPAPAPNAPERRQRRTTKNDFLFKWAALFILAMFVAALSYRVVTEGPQPAPVTIINNGCCGDCGKKAPAAEKPTASKPQSSSIHRQTTLVVRVKVEPPVQQAYYPPQQRIVVYSGEYHDGPRFRSQYPPFPRPYR